MPPLKGKSQSGSWRQGALIKNTITLSGTDGIVAANPDGELSWSQEIGVRSGSFYAALPVQRSVSEYFGRSQLSTYHIYGGTQRLCLLCYGHNTASVLSGAQESESGRQSGGKRAAEARSSSARDSRRGALVAESGVPTREPARQCSAGASDVSMYDNPCFYPPRGSIRAAALIHIRELILTFLSRNPVGKMRYPLCSKRLGD